MISNNYFDLFHITPCVFVNRKELDNKFQKLQKFFHPDTQNNILDNNASDELSTKITTAYDTLKSPLGCVNHLLALKKCKPLEGSPSTIENPTLLEEIMDLEERLLEEDDIHHLQQEVEKNINTLAKRIEESFIKNDIKKLEQEALYFFYYFKFLQKLKN